MEFDPFDVTTWRPTESLENPEVRAALGIKIDEIIADSNYWHKINDLRRVLEGHSPSPLFETLIKTDEEFRKLAEWLMASDGRRELASMALTSYLRQRECPSCHNLIDETELKSPPQFDWNSIEG